MTVPDDLYCKACNPDVTLSMRLSLYHTLSTYITLRNLALTLPPHSTSTDTGMSRLSLSDADKQARDWFAATARELGCKVRIDAMGNTFAVRPGRQAGRPTCAGSHLDTQPTGGRYDGILGVCAGVEMLRVLKEEAIETEFPVGVVNWTNEEGARFPISMVSSGVWAGAIPLETAHSLKEVGTGGRTMKQELERIGYLGEMEASYTAMPIGVPPPPRHDRILAGFAHSNALKTLLSNPTADPIYHPEQGPHLESTNRHIGIVRGVQAYRWHTITVRGRDTHTGTTALPLRADALLTAAKLILASHRIAAAHGGLASTGILTPSPSSVNTVPGLVTFSLDIRHPDDATLLRMEAAMQTEFAALASGAQLAAGEVRGRPCGVSWRLDAPSEAVVFDADCVACVRASCAGLASVEMRSGAGHDSVFTSRRVPTAMVFVPCRDGVSHNPAEYCKKEDCANGAQVLMGAVLRYDGLRRERAGA
ncbi:hypothetical protein MMC27_002502 [Xylographa pallens]|nr:hypothetical protein [Xylographa pallens]